MKTNPLRSSNIRETNEKLVLGLIHKHGTLSQSEIVNLTGLKAPTVFRIFSFLEEGGYIKITLDQPVDSDKKGRKPVYYAVNPLAYYIIGVDLWARSAAIVLEDFRGTAIYQHLQPLESTMNAHDVFKVVCELISNALAFTDIDQEKILGIGIGAPGKVNINTGNVLYYSRIEGMENYPLGSLIEDQFQIPVQVHNNASMVALSAYRYGIAHDIGSLLTILIRSGVGGSFLNEKNLLVTNGATTLELGHMSLDLQGAPCECGSPGCVESFLSEDAFMEELAKVVTIKEITDLDKLSPGEIDDSLTSIIKTKGIILAQVVRNLFYLFGPQTFLIVTRSQILSKLLANEVQAVLSTDNHLCSGLNLTLLSTKYDPSQACRGAIELVLNKYFS
jgi:predicted NBD/HSP70 family sugar kinase